MKPSIGRIVHWVDQKREHRAAIITAVHDSEIVSLTVFRPFNPNDPPASGPGCTIIELASHFEGPDPVSYTWHWPERVE